MLKLLKKRAPSFDEELTGYYPRLQRFALRLCGDPVLAEDLVQQTYVQALSKREQFVAGTRLDSWLYRILQNLYFNLRSAAAVAGRKAHLVAVSEEPYLDDPPAEMTRDLERVVVAIAELPEHYRIVLLLVTVEGLSYKEVAKMLEVPIGTVTSRLARARAILVEKYV